MLAASKLQIGLAVKKLIIECALDEQYAALYEAAMRVASSFLEHARWVIENTPEKELKAHYLITVRVKSPGCWVANWTKTYTVRDTDRGRSIASKLRKGAAPQVGKKITVELPKGRGISYPANTFLVLPRELREVAVYHEQLLSVLRKAAQENRLQKRAVSYCLDRGAKAAEQCLHSIEASRQLRMIRTVELGNAEPEIAQGEVEVIPLP